MDDFPSLKARRLLAILAREPLNYRVVLAILTREPLNYRVVRQRGSHRTLEASGRPRVVFAFHDRQTIRPRSVKHILCDQVGLDGAEARRLP